jgi:hypothetical protein
VVSDAVVLLPALVVCAGSAFWDLSRVGNMARQQLRNSNEEQNAGPGNTRVEDVILS